MMLFINTSITYNIPTYHTRIIIKLAAHYCFAFIYEINAEKSQVISDLKSSIDLQYLFLMAETSHTIIVSIQFLATRLS